MLKNKPRVIFRADGNSQIGLGHVVRSLALAEILRDEFHCCFAIQEPSHALRMQIASVCAEIIILEETAADDKTIIHELDHYLKGNEIVVLDGYKFETGYQKHIKSKGCCLICIDDIHAYHFFADVIINHAGGISRADYSLEPYTSTYLGTEYALLRTPFLEQKSRQSNDSFAFDNVFINMGGADPLNYSCTVLEKVIKLENIKNIFVVTGTSYQYLESLTKLISIDYRITHLSNLSADEIAQLMSKCGVAICPPSTICYEYASLGGLLFLKKTADNQKDVEAFFLQNGIALDFDTHFTEIISQAAYDIADKINQNQRAYFDGQSNNRLRKIFSDCVNKAKLNIRKAEEKDLEITYEWANDALVRSFSYNQDQIDFSNHKKWFEKKIKDQSVIYYIIEYNSLPVGQIRFDGEEIHTISYLISKQLRGKGLGHVLLSKGVEQLLKDVKGVKQIIGYVMKSNVASCKAFQKAGFYKSSDTNIPYPDSYKFETNLF